MLMTSNYQAKKNTTPPCQFMILIFPMIFPMFPHGFPVCSPFFPTELWRFLGSHLIQVALPSRGLSAAPWNSNFPSCQTGHDWPMANGKLQHPTGSGEIMS
jgi:hypothetical protein